MNIRKISIGGAAIWHDGDALDPMEPRIFEPDWLRQSGRLVGMSSGRNEAFFLRHAGQDMVLRHFWRGGLVGKVNRDLYLKVPAGRSRAMREFELLAWMEEQGLPVPHPMAARYRPAGPFYRADIITRHIPDTRTMADILRDTSLLPDIWDETGRVIGRMHALGVFHSDLNCRNILIDGGGRVWLIDFDKCARRAPGGWDVENLARLKRSFEKEKGKVPGLHWDETAWEALLAGHKRERGAGAPDRT